MATYSVSITEAASAADSYLARRLSDADFAAWLAADNRPRCILVEVGVYSGGETTRYFSNLGYTSGPGESPASIAYEDILIGIPEIRSAMAEAFRGRSLISYGEIEIDNSGGVRDSWLNDAWDKRDVRIYLGAPTWARSDFRQVFYGTIEDIRARDGNTLALKIRDRQVILDVPLQTKVIGSGSAHSNQKRAVAYGSCYNVEPKQADSSGTLELHDGALSEITMVYQDGVPYNLYVLRYPGGAPPLGAYIAAFTYTGRITADVVGFETKTGDIVKRILIERAGLTEAQIDPAAITAYNAAASGNATVGFYSTDDAETVASALDTLLSGIGGYYTIGRDGRFTGGVFDRPSLGTSLLTLTADDIEDGEIELLRRIVPPLSISIGYKRYWSTLTSVSASVTDPTTRTRFGEQYAFHKSGYTPPAEYRGIDKKMEGSCFALAAHASIEGARRGLLWGELRYVFRLKTFLAPQQLRIGDCITVQVPRYGFDAGVKVIIVGMRESLTGGWLELEIFR